VNVGDTETVTHATASTDPVATDMDGDGLTDGEEETVWGSNPRKRDTDDDGYPDFVDPNISTENRPPNVSVLPHDKELLSYRGGAERELRDNDLTHNDAGFREEFVFNVTDESAVHDVTARAKYTLTDKTVWENIEQSDITENDLSDESSTYVTPSSGETIRQSNYHSQYTVDFPQKGWAGEGPTKYEVTIKDEHGNGYTMEITPNNQPWFKTGDGAVTYAASVTPVYAGTATAGSAAVAEIAGTQVGLATVGTAGAAATVTGLTLAGTLYVADQNQPADGYEKIEQTQQLGQGTATANEYEVTRTVSAQGRQIDITEAITISEGAVFEKDGHTRGYGLAYMAETTSIEKEEQEDDTSEETDDEEDTLGDVIEDGEVTTDEDGDIQVSQKTKERLRVLVKEGSRVGWELLEENLDDSSPDRNLQVSYLDVGKGTAILVDGPSKNMLIDAGGKQSDFKSSLDSHLDDDDTIHTVVITHNHSDHDRNLDYVLNNYDVNRVYFNSTSSQSYLTEEKFAAQFGTANSPREYVIEKDTNTTMQLGLGATATIAHLNITDSRNNPTDANSLITRVSYRGFSFVMTGDIRSETEESLMESELIDAQNVDVLQAPHHGSAASSTNERVLHSEFLEYTSPQSIVISNRNLGAAEYHPNCGVFDRISAMSGPTPDVYWTAPHGDIEYVVMAGYRGSASLNRPKTDDSNIQKTDPETLQDSVLTEDCE